VSVRDGEEAAAALAGGADIIDAKDPEAGPLGAVSLETLREIYQTVCSAALVTAALGDAVHERTVEDLAHAYAAQGAGLVKIGFAGIEDVDRAASLLAAAARGATAGGRGRCGVVAVAYADGHLVGSLYRDALTRAAMTARVHGVLLDTADKNGPGVRDLLSQQELASWISEARGKRLLVAVAGRLGLDDLEFARDAGADIAGVRGAACEAGRMGRVTTPRVRALQARLRSAVPV